MTFLAALIVPAIVALIVAVLVLRLDSHYLALASLAVAQIVFLLAVSWQSLTGGANGVPGVPGIGLLGWMCHAACRCWASCGRWWHSPHSSSGNCRAAPMAARGR